MLLQWKTLLEPGSGAGGVAFRVKISFFLEDKSFLDNAGRPVYERGHSSALPPLKTWLVPKGESQGGIQGEGNSTSGEVRGAASLQKAISQASHSRKTIGLLRMQQGHPGRRRSD